MARYPLISGFTLVNNARILQYPFEASVLSILPVCEEFVINCGDSDDDTREWCLSLKARYPNKIKVHFTTWQKENQSGGYQLKAQTDFALAQCRFPWCFYIQADEVFCELGLKELYPIIEKANRIDEVDGVLFKYRHFYGSYDYEIKGRNWYPHEVRLFKNGRGIEAFRDAQGFRKNGTPLLVLQSHSEMFHYGYVRNETSFLTKEKWMGLWWGKNQTLGSGSAPLIHHVGIQRYRGKHPAAMIPFLRPIPFDPTESPRKWDRREIKNMLTLIWEAFFPWRIRPFKNYKIYYATLWDRFLSERP